MHLIYVINHGIIDTMDTSHDYALEKECLKTIFHMKVVCGFVCLFVFNLDFLPCSII